MDEFSDADWADYFGSLEGNFLDSYDLMPAYDTQTGTYDLSGSTPTGGYFNQLGNWMAPGSSTPDSTTISDSAWDTFLKSLAPSGGFNTGGLLTAGLGALGGAVSSATSPSSTTSTTAPWNAQQPYLLDLFAKASGQLNTIDPLTAKAKLNYGSLLGGPSQNPYLGMDNPYLSKAIDNAQSDFMKGFQPLVNQANVQSGSFGNSGVAQTYGKEAADQLGRINTNMRMQDYGAQQQLAENAVGRTASATQGAADFNFSPLKNYGSLITGQNFGSTTTNPMYQNTMGSVLGGALAGSSIYNNLFGGK